MDSGVVYSLDSKAGGRRLQLRNGATDAALKEVRNGEFDSLWCYYGNFEPLASIDLSDYEGKFVFQSSEPQNVSWISGLSSIESIKIRGKIKGKIDFRKMPNLRSADVDWCAATNKIISSGLSLRSLCLSRFSGLLSDFSENTLINLQTLGLTGALESLAGVRRFSSLHEISLWNMKKLIDISELEFCRDLKCLQIEGCNQIAYESVLKKLSKLEVLFFENSELNSISSLPSDSLKKVILGEKTVVTDGDVESFLQFPKLERVVFTKKKGYKYSGEELDELLKKRV